VRQFFLSFPKDIEEAAAIGRLRKISKLFLGIVIAVGQAFYR